MTVDKVNQILEQAGAGVTEALSQPETYTQLAVVIIVYVVAFLLSKRLRHYLPLLNQGLDAVAAQPLRQFAGKLGSLLFPVIAIVLLRISVEISESLLDHGWVNQVALSISVLLLFHSIIRDFISSHVGAGLFRWIGMPLVLLYLFGLLDILSLASHYLLPLL